MANNPRRSVKNACWAILYVFLSLRLKFQTNFAVSNGFRLFPPLVRVRDV
jgi:hypothetical protein